MTNEEIQGYIVMEATMEPMKPKIVRCVNEPNIFYVRFESCLQAFDCFNRNRRNYSLSAMIEGMKADHIQELLRKGTFTGENGHPMETDIKRIMSIEPKNACHRICDYEFRGKLLYGVIETLNDDMWGKQFSKHILQGLHPSFSLRALAPITKLADGKSLIKSKPHIVTYDRVILPSHKEAYINNEKPCEVIMTGTTESATEIETENLFTPAYNNSFNDIFKPIQEQAVVEALNYVKDESKRLKELATFFNSSMEKVTLTKEGTVCIEEDNGERIVIFLEDYINNDINNYFTKINDSIR